MADARVSEAPFNEINVTPFIDIMLVLIVVMLLSLPIATHKLPVDLPQGPSDQPIPEEPHRLAIDRGGALSFDGRPVTDAQLPGILSAMRDRPGAVLQMHPDPESRYERFDAVLAVVKHAGITRLGFLGNEPLKD